MSVYEAPEPLVMNRRVVSQISEYLDPQQIFKLITEKHYNYEKSPQRLISRDRALMSLAYCSGGRISAIVGGNRYQSQGKGKDRIAIVVGKHRGLQRDNITFIQKNNYILVKGMAVVKRSRKVIAKYGTQVGVRDDFTIPLRCGLDDNAFWDQLVPFAWLILEYIYFYDAYTKQRGKLFNIGRARAWKIINDVTGQFPNWFRAQAEHFYGNFLLKDSVKLSKFVKVVRPEQVGHYIGYSWKAYSKKGINTEWIMEEQKKIFTRIKVIRQKIKHQTE